MVLHPLYDTNAKVFVVTIKGQEIEACSISELLARVGPGHTVRDYYPDGVPFELLPRGFSATPGSGYIRPAANIRRPKHMMPRPACSEPAGEVLVERAPWEPAKRKSRPRASKALPAPIPPKPERDATPEERAVYSERDNAILDAWAAGATGPDLAQRFNMSPSAIGANLIPKARLRGDPRAVVRNAKMHGSKVNRLTGSRYR